MMRPADCDLREAEALPLRPASTVMVIRDSPPGLEVFMMRRHAASAFAPGFFVFPGGRVDGVDAAAELEPFSPYLDDRAASAVLGIDGGGLAYFVAAIRECFEESGLLLARAADGSRPVPADGDRRSVHHGELSLVELCRRDALVLDTAELRYVAHWVTPASERSRRFDTRFFLAPAPSGQPGRHDDAELVASRWITPSHALARGAAGELSIMPPTAANLAFLDGCPTVAAALAKAGSAPRPPRIEPWFRRSPTGEILELVTDGTQSES